MAKDFVGSGFEATRQKGKRNITAASGGVTPRDGKVKQTTQSTGAVRVKHRELEVEDVDAATYVDHTAAAVHESMADLVALGLVDGAVMGSYDEACLTEPQGFTPEQVRVLREREQATQSVFARYLGVSVNTVGQWERGERRATGAAAKLLSLVDKHGLAYIR